MKLKFVQKYFDFEEGKVYEFENCKAQVEYYLSLGVAELFEDKVEKKAKK